MSAFLRRLFSSDASPADGLTQPKREAIIDLLNFCMCADQKVLMEEEITIDDEIQGFSWDPSVDFRTFAAQSLERAKAAVATPESRRIALASISDRLESPEAMEGALVLCHKVFKADGEYAPVEREVFQEIKRAFGLRE